MLLVCSAKSNLATSHRFWIGWYGLLGRLIMTVKCELNHLYSGMFHQVLVSSFHAHKL